MEFYSKQKCFITTLHASKLVSFANSTFIPANICGKDGFSEESKECDPKSVYKNMQELQLLVYKHVFTG